MVVSCCVTNCTNRFVKGSGLAFFRFPQQPKERRELWIKSLKRRCLDTPSPTKSRLTLDLGLWAPSKHDRVCGKHFITGRPHSDPLHPDYAPNKSLGYAKKTSASRRYESLKMREERKRNAKEEKEQAEAAATALLSFSETSNIPTPTHIEKGTQTFSDITQSLVFMKCQVTTLETEIQIVRGANLKLREKVAQLESEKQALQDELNKEKLNYENVPNYTVEIS